MNAQIIKDFLKKFSSTVLFVHKQELLKILEYLKKFENDEIAQSTFGEHYKSCPWSHNNASNGPDTCFCFKVRRKEEEAENIMQLYLQ